MGAVPESQIKQFIDKLAGPDAGDPKAEIEAALTEAKQLLADGDFNGAAQILVPSCRPTRKTPQRLPVSRMHDRSRAI